MTSQELRDALFIPSDQRENFKQIIAKRSDLTKFSRGRFVTPGADTLYRAGTVLGQVTAAGPTQYQLKPYNAANVDGSQVAVGVLSEDALVSMGTGDGGEVVYITRGELFFDKLIAPDGGWAAQLGARQYVEGGVNLVIF